MDEISTLEHTTLKVGRYVFGDSEVFILNL